MLCGHHPLSRDGINAHRQRIGVENYVQLHVGANLNIRPMDYTSAAAIKRLSIRSDIAIIVAAHTCHNISYNNLGSLKNIRIIEANIISIEITEKSA